MIASMIKLIIVLLNFAFKKRLVNETRAIALVRAGTQANQLASAIDCADNNKFCQDSKEICSLFFVSDIKKVYQGNIPFMKTILCMLSLKA